MKFTFSSFAKKIVEEDMEVMQKALVVAHSYHTSKGNYVDAQKISTVLSKNLDEHGCLKLGGGNQLLIEDFIHHVKEMGDQKGSWFQVDDRLVLISNELESS